MKSRAALISAKFDLASKINEGVNINLRLSDFY